MNTRTNNNYIIIFIIMTLLVGFFIGGKYNYNNLSQLIKKDTMYIKGSNDTLIKHTIDTIYITKQKIKTIERDKIDTIYVTQSFTKVIDTTINEARIEVSYFYPEDYAKIKLQQKVTEILRIDTIKTFAPIEIPVVDYKTTISTGVVGIGVGLIIGILLIK